MAELILLQTFIDFELETTANGLQTPLITMHGSMVDGTPVQVKVHDFLPYFYIEGSDAVSCSDIEEVFSTSFTKGKCLHVEDARKQSLYGYGNSTSAFMKLYFNTPYCFKAAKLHLENSAFLKAQNFRVKTYESNFPFVLRFMNDLNITGMSYVKIKKFNEVQKSGTTLYNEPHTVSCSFTEIEALKCEGEYLKLPPLKILSFDIETCGETTSFPNAQRDPIIQIGNSVQCFGSDEIKQSIFCLQEVSPIPGKEVHWFSTEAELLCAWRDYLLAVDPDIVIGYNIKNFDFPYILERAEVFNLKNFNMLGRTKNPSKIISRQQSSNNFGAFEARDINLEGRTVLDLLHIVRREHKLRSYSLNSVSYHFLNEQKEDVPYTAISGLQAKSPETRKRIAIYCLQDTYLPLRLLDKLNIIVNYVELSRATKVPLEYFLTRGAAIKVLSQIYHEAKISGYAIPDLNVAGNEEGFEGAFVMDPIKDYYRDPIAVLDFSSLYPSIIISKNLCYTTLMTKKQHTELGGTESPTGNYFCNVETKEGLLPRILKNLLQSRKEAKELLKKETDPFLARSYDGRQNALKICANSIYGFTGSFTGQLPCIEISQSTTAFGREMIAKTKRLIEDSFSRQRGYIFDAQIIYGDTDSVMIHFKNLDYGKVAEQLEASGITAEYDEHQRKIKFVMDEAKKISVFVTSHFEKPVSLAFEKVYCPYLLMNKKRYAGLIYTKPEKYDRIDTKGIETVRRDNCELVKDVITVCLNKILLERDVEGAMVYVKQTVRDIYTDRVDLSQLVISKTYTKENYATKLPHTALAERLRKRGVHVGIGDRIPYVIVQGDKKMQANEKSEDPVYVLENNLPIDKEYYIENQLTKPIQRLFEPIMDNVSSLFSGEHTTVMTKSVSMKGPMNAFVKVVDECIGCRKSGTIICSECKPNFFEFYESLQEVYNTKTKKFHECWTQCQRCQGSVINEVLCVNRICPIWYKRTKLRKELAPLQAKIDGLNRLSW
ncbi:DNA polymerase delta subunit 1 [Enteropsectra breve]|nr:DNA polymerase delta subunit 1 [Enteropsectra breve]